MENYLLNITSNNVLYENNFMIILCKQNKICINKLYKHISRNVSILIVCFLTINLLMQEF